MSFLSDGLSNVAFQLQSTTEAALLSPSVFLSTWNQVVQAQLSLAGIQPGSHGQRASSTLIIREVFNDAEVDNRFAIWSPGDGVIKLNHSYIDRFVAAANLSPLVGELAEALGSATLCFQQQTPGQLFPQVLAWSDLAVGLARAIGLYGLQTSGNQVSSLWSPNQILPFTTFKYQELTRCYRKQRSGFRGQDYINNISTGGTDADIAYGLFIELFTVVSNWSAVSDLLSWAAGAVVDPTTFNRSAQQQYNDLITQLAIACQVDIRSLLYTWGFQAVSVLDNLPEGLPRLTTSQPMVMGQRFKQNIDPGLVAREENTINLPGLTLGGHDVHGMGQGTGPVLVLLDNPPSDMRTFKSLKSVLLAGYESNRLPQEQLVLYNVGEAGSPSQTLLVPISMAGWDLASYVDLTPGTNQVLVPCRVLELGVPDTGFIQTVTTWDAGGNETTQDVQVQVYTYAVIAYEGGEAYNYVNSLNSQVSQVISVLRYPLDKFKDPISGNIISNTGGHCEVVKSMVTQIGLSSLVLRSFINTSLLKDSTGAIQGTQIDTIPLSQDPLFAPYRERPLSEGRSDINVLGSIKDPVAAELVGYSTRRVGADLAASSGVSISTSGYQTEDQVTKALQDLQPIAPVQVVDIPANLVKAVTDLHTTVLPDDQKLQILRDAYAALPDQLKSVLQAANLTQPLIIPQIDGTTLNTGWIKSGPETFSIHDTLLKIAKDLDPNAPLPPQDPAVEQRWRDLQDQVNQSSASNSVLDQLGNFIANGFDGLSISNHDPRNPMTYLNGTFLSNVMGSVQIGKGGFLGVLDFSKNPRASAGVIGSIVAAGVAACGIEAICPGTAPLIAQGIQDGLTQIAVLDKPPLDVTINLANQLAQNITNTAFANDPQAKYLAGQTINFLTGLAYDAVNGKLVAHDARDLFSITLNHGTFDLSKPVNDTIGPLTNGVAQQAAYINVVLGLSTASYQNTFDPRLQALVQADYAGVNAAQFTLNQPSLVITPGNGGSGHGDINFLQDLFTGGGTTLSILQQGLGLNRSAALQGTLNSLASQQSSEASLQNLRAALLQEQIAYQVLADQKEGQTLTDNTGDLSSLLNKVTIYSTSGAGADLASSFDPAKSVFSASNKKPSSLKQILSDIKAASDPSLPVDYSGAPLSVDHVFDGAFANLKPKNSQSTQNKPYWALALVMPPGIEDASVQDLFNALTKNQDPSSNDLLKDLSMYALAKLETVGGGGSYTFEVMPAVKSVAQTQGMQAPGADRGVQLRSSLNIAKLNVPGSTPVYQVMGVNEEFVEFVGCFFGWTDQHGLDTRQKSQYEDIPNLDPKSGALIANAGKQFYRGFQESQVVRKLQLSGQPLKLTIQSYAGAFASPGSPTAQGIQIGVAGYIVGLERYAQRDDRVWYRIVFRVTDHTMLDATTQLALVSNNGSSKFSNQVALVPNNGSSKFINDGSHVAIVANNAGGFTAGSGSIVSNGAGKIISNGAGKYGGQTELSAVPNLDFNGDVVQPTIPASQLPTPITWGNPGTAGVGAGKTFQSTNSPGLVTVPIGFVQDLTLSPPPTAIPSVPVLGSNSGLFQNPVFS